MLSAEDQLTPYLWQAITIGKGSYAFPSDAEFLDALLHKDMYQTLRSRGTKYFLYMLEERSPFPKGLPPFGDDTISIEHIMPRTLTLYWKEYLSNTTMQNYESLLHRVGNLALTNYNGEMSNKDFKDKQKIYKSSKFYYTMKIAEYDKWQISEIEERSQKLVEEALKIWYLPEKYQKLKAVSKSFHTLSEDTSQYAFTKPAVLLIGSQEYNVTYWADFLPILCKVFDKEDHDAFIEVADPDKISALGIEDEDHKYAGNNYRVFFLDEETAIAAGYRPCAVCMPEAYKVWKVKQSS